jgi:formylglycine-generating enzyme required for sulfatase activity
MAQLLDNAELASLSPGQRPFGPGDWELVERAGPDNLWLARRGVDASAPRAILALMTDANAVERLRSQRARLEMLINVAIHPGLVPLLRVRFVDQLATLEYEHVHGMSLPTLAKELRPSLGRLWPRRVIELLERLCEPLGFLHRFLPPVVHRMLSADRILMLDGSPRLMDWARGGLMEAGGAISPLASPQRARGAPPDPRDDVYSLGVLWYQLLLGDFGAGRPGGSQWRRRLSEASVDADMLSLLETCFEDDPTDRPADAGELKARLAALGRAPAAVPATVMAPEPPPAPPAIEVAAPAAQPPVVEAADAPRTRTRRSGEAVRSLLDRLEQKEPELQKLITNSVGMKFILIPPGTFLMGSPADETGRRENEGPQHEVTLARPFYVGVYLVSQREYARVLGINPAYFQEVAGGGPDHPVERVTWNDAVDFCRRLSARAEEATEGRSYRLLTEAEWEYACRAGSTTPFSCGTGLSVALANFDSLIPQGDGSTGLRLERTTRVGSYPANHFGLHDMHGNVWEWCSDWFSADAYSTAGRKDPTGPESGQMRLLRGGSWQNQAVTCRSAYRNALAPHLRDRCTGFRVVMVQGKVQRDSPR